MVDMLNPIQGGFGRRTTGRAAPAGHGSIPISNGRPPRMLRSRSETAFPDQRPL